MEREPINEENTTPRQWRLWLRSHSPSWGLKLYQAMTIFEKVGLFIMIGLVAVSGTVSATNYISGHTQLIPQNGGSYREAAVGQPRYINPIMASANDLDVDITRLVYSGLFRFNSDLKLVNDLADKVEISDDQKQYTISIRQDVTWHDGQRLTADDVVFTVRSIQTPDYGSPLMAAFQGVEIEKVDDYKVRFKLKQPYASFLTSLIVGIVPQHMWSAIEPQNAMLAEQILKPVGTGPFKFAEISTHRKTGDITAYRLIRNDNYYGAKPYLDHIIFTFYSTLDEAIAALQSGKVDGLGFLPLDYLDNVSKQRRLTINQLLIPQYFAVFFNTQKNEALNEAGVRSALALALDRQEIVDQALNSQGVPLHVPIPPAILGSGYEFSLPQANLTAAAQNLDESGWEVGESGIRYKNGKKLAIKITTTDWPEYVKTAEIIKEQWKKIGVEVTLENFSAGMIQQTVVQPRDYEALIFGEILPPDPDPYPFWHSTQTRSPGLNLALFKNQEVDKLLEEARKTSDLNRRQELYRDFQNKILELNPAIILYQPYYLFVTSGVYGVDAKYADLPAGRFNNIEQWHVRTKRVWK